MNLDVVAGVLTFITCSVVFLCIVAPDPRRVLLPTLFTYFLHVTIGLTDHFQNGLGDADAAYYDQVAQSIVAGYEVSVTAGKEGLPNLLAFIYGFFGHAPELGLLINALAVALLVTITARTARILHLPVALSSWVVAVYPAFIVWGPQLLREALVWLFIGLLALGSAKLATRRASLPAVALIITAFFGLLSFRGPLAIVLVVASLGAVVSARTGKLRYAVLAVIIAGFGMNFLGPQLGGVLERFDLERVETSREALSRTAGSGFGQSMSTTSVSGLFSVFLRVLAGPFPWEVGSVGLAGFAEGILWVALVLAALAGYRQLENRRNMMVLLYPAMALFATLVISSGNYGTMVRLRTQIAVLLIPLAAAGLAHIFRRQPRDLSRQRHPSGVASAK